MTMPRTMISTTLTLIVLCGPHSLGEGPRAPATAAHAHAPGGKQQESEDKQQTPGGLLQAPAGRLQSRGSALRSPISRQRAPGEGPQAPGDMPQSPGGKPGALPAALEEAVQLVFADYEVTARYDYVMTGKVRLLLFWIGKDDVGSGLVRIERGVEMPGLQAIRLKIGSDPAKAPRRINRWGTATEVVAPSPQTGAVVSAFFGFMKDTEGDSVDEVEVELASEAGQHLFKATINHTGPRAASSSVLPIVSPVDFTIGELEQAERMVLDQYATAFDPARYVELRGERRRCGGGRSFLFTLKAIIDEAVEGAAAPQRRCFLYNSKPYALALRHTEPRASTRLGFDLADGERVENTYPDLLAADFEIRNETTGSTTEFELLLGTRGALRGVPVRAVYQPNFWFKAILHLRAVSSPHGTFTADR